MMMLFVLQSPRRSVMSTIRPVAGAAGSVTVKAASAFSDSDASVVNSAYGVAALAVRRVGVSTSS